MMPRASVRGSLLYCLLHGVCDTNMCDARAAACRRAGSLRGWKGVSGTPIPGVVGLGEPPADDGVCGTRVVNPDGSVSSGGGLAGVDKTISGGGGGGGRGLLFEF